MSLYTARVINDKLAGATKNTPFCFNNHSKCESVDNETIIHLQGICFATNTTPHKGS